MNEQWQRLTRSVGNLFMGMISKVLPYLNAILMVLTEIVSSVATLLGYKIDDFDFFDEAAVTGVEDFGDSLDSAAESAKKLKQGLRGFDKLNVITTPSETSSGVGSGAGGINPKLMDAFNSAFDEYQRKLDNVEMKATKIRDKIMEWLGFTKQVDEETGDVSFKFDHITGGTVLGALAIGGSIYRGINFILKMLNKIGLIKFTSIGGLIKAIKGIDLETMNGKLANFIIKLASINTTALLVAAAIAAIGGALIYAYNHSETFRNKVNEAFGSVAELVKDIYEVISTKTQEMWEIVEPIWNIFKDTVVFVLTSVYDTVVFVFSTIADKISGTAKIISDLIHGDFSGAFDDFKDMVVDIWENWSDYFGKIGENFGNWVDDVKDTLENDFVPKAKEKIQEFIDKVGEMPGKFGEFIGEAVGTIWRIITETDWIELGKKIIKGIVDGFGKIYDFGKKIKEKASELFNNIKDAITNIKWSKIGKQILEGILDGLKWTKGLLDDFADGFMKGLKKGLKINSPSKLVIENKIGDYTFEGITFGMDKQIPTLKEQAKDIVDTLNSGIKESSLDYDFNYNIPRFNSSSMDFNTASSSIGTNSNSKTTFNPTFIIQVGNKEIAKQVITDLQDMAIDNGKPITIGG